jgi:hypothetical protein
MGERPTHPELLDYMARRYVESGWSIKAMQRLILLSSTWQMSSQITEEKMDKDPANLWRSRFNRRRLDVEEIRDAFLAVDGSLDLTMGGTLQPGSGNGGAEFSDGRKSLNPDESRRRTVYLQLRRANLPSFLNLFDFGDATTTIEARARTNVATQALFMMNSRFVEERALSFAKQLLDDANLDDAARVQRAYLLITSTMITNTAQSDLIKDTQDYIRGFEQRAGGPSARLAAWQSFCRILMASNDFVYVN